MWQLKECLRLFNILVTHMRISSVYPVLWWHKKLWDLVVSSTCIILSCVIKTMDDIWQNLWGLHSCSWMDWLHFQHSIPFNYRMLLKLGGAMCVQDEDVAEPTAKKRSVVKNSRGQKHIQKYYCGTNFPGLYHFRPQVEFCMIEGSCLSKTYSLWKSRMWVSLVLSMIC